MPRRRHTRRRWPILGVLLAVVLLAIAGGLTAARAAGIYEDVQEAQRRLTRAAALIEQNALRITPQQADEASDELAAADRALTRASDALETDPAIRVARLIPPVATQVTAAETMVEAGRLVTARHSDVQRLLQGFIQARDSGTGRERIAAFARFADSHRDGILAVVAAVEDADALASTIPSEGLVGPLAGARTLLLGRLAQVRPLVAAARSSAEVVPRLMGIGGERRYLILALDNAELRPIGGLIGAFATPRFRDGLLDQERFRDIFEIDRHDQEIYVKPPDPLDHHLLGGFTWQVADAGWWPDFADSVAEVRRMYRIETGKDDVQGTVAFTPELVDELLKVVGPVRVAEAGITVHPGETYLISLEQVEVLNRGEGRKQFLAQLASQVLRRLFALPPERYPEVFEALDRAGKRRQLQVLMDDPQVQASIDDLGWYTPFTFPEGGDRLAVMETNMAPVSKLDVLLDMDHALEVDLQRDGSAQERLVTTFTNRFGPDLPAELERVRSTFFSGNLGSFQRRYLVPDAQLISVTSDDRFVPLSGPGTEELESGCLAVGNYQLIRPGVTHLETRYIAPAVVRSAGGTAWRYSLRFHKQAGRDRDTLTIRVTVPQGFQPTTWSEGGSRIDEDTVGFSFTTEFDRQVEVVYAPD